MPLGHRCLTILDDVRRVAIALSFGIVATILVSPPGFGEPLVIETPPPGTPYKMYDTSLALIIGASRYINNASWNSLDVVPQEVEIVRAALVEQGFQTEVLLDPKGTELSLRIKRFLLQKVGRDTRLLIYFAGHGWTDGQKTGYIVPVDAPSADADDLVSNLISMEEIKGWSYTAKAKHIFFVFDSCFSGAVFLTRGNLKPSPFYLNDVDRPVRQYLTSGSATEQVPDRLDFANAFVAGLRGEADIVKDGIITVNELGYWLKTYIIGQGLQTPQFGSDPKIEFRGGDLLFKPRPTSDAVGTAPVVAPVVAQVNNPSGTGGPRLAALRSLGEPSKPSGRAFAGVEVLYYAKLADGTKVRDVLNEHSIPFVVTRAQLPDKFEVNSIACGPDIPVEALKALAVALIDGGVPIRAIFQFRRPEEKLRRLELLSSTADQAGKVALDTPPLSVDQITQLTRCPVSLENKPDPKRLQ